MEFPDDRGLRDVLTRLEVTPAALLGHGGEAWVYALDADRVVRVLHEGADDSNVRQPQTLVNELRSPAFPFQLPEVLSVEEINGRWFSIERRLAGRSLMDHLAVLDGRDRDQMVESYLDATARLGDLRLVERGWFGELMGDDPIRSPTWPEYLYARAAASLRRSSPVLRDIDPAGIVDALPLRSVNAAPDGARFVHLDAFPGNVLAAGTSITAVLDIGVTSVAGDRLFDPVSAAVYLAAPGITPVAGPRDVDVAMSWLRTAGIEDWFVPVQRWLAAYWSFALDDVNLYEWCELTLRT